MVGIAPPPGDINLDDDIQPRDNASLTDANAMVVTDAPVTNQRTIKAHIGWSAPKPPVSDVFAGMSTDGGVSLRKSLAMRDGMESEREKLAIVNEIARQKGSELTPAEVSVLYDFQRADYMSNPDDVFERKFSEKFHTEALKVRENNPNSPIQKALREDPEEVLKLTDLSQHATQIREYAKTIGEELHKEWKDAGIVSSGLQLAGQFLPFMSAWNLHNVLQGPNTARSILPGENLGQGVDHLLRLPYPEAVKKLKAAVAEVRKTSTLDAITLVQAVLGYTSTDSYMNNLVGITDAAGLGSLAGKGLYKAGVATGNLAERVSLARAARQRALKATTPEDAAEAAVTEMQKEVGVIPATPPRTFFIPTDVARNLESVSIPEPKVTGFTTAKGSTYEITPKGTTIRNKAERPDVGHEGDKGVKPESARTVYMDLDEANKIAPPNGKWRILEGKEGKLGISIWNDRRNAYGIPFDETQKAVFSETPKVGMIPVELWDVKKLPHNTKSYSNVHFGNKITELKRGDETPVFWTNQAENEGFLPGKAGEGMVPVYMDSNYAIRFGVPQMGEVYYLRPSVIKNLKEVKKFGRVPEIKAKFDNEGTPYFREQGGAMISASKEQGEGMMPVTISKDGTVHFVMSGAQKDAQKAVRDHSLAVANPEMKIDEVLTQVGDHDKAATVKAVQRMAQPQATDLISSLPSAMNPKNFFGKGGALSNAFTDKIITKFTNDTQHLLSVLGKLDVSRLTEEALAVGIQETQDKIKRQYAGRVNDGAIDWLHIPPELNPNKANLDTVIGRFGDLNSRPFESRGAAELYLKEIYKFTPDEATVAQQGNSFYIQVQRFIDETTEGVRKANITPKNTTPVSMFNMALNRLRTSEDLLADFQRNNRHVATHAPQILNKLLREQIDSTARSLTKAERRDVEAILRYNRDELNPALGPNKRGNFYPTAADFEKAYFDKFGKLPSEGQTAHYFNYTRLSDFDYTIRNLAMYRDKGRLGLEQFSYSFKDAKGVTQPVPYFEGKELDKFPWGGQNAGIVVVDSADGSARFMYKHGKDGLLDQLSRETIDKLIKERSFKVIQLFNPTKRPFSDVEFAGGKIGEQVHFVVTDTTARKPLAFQQLEYRPGGHSIYMDDWYVKQPQLQVGQAGRLHYYGDNAVMNFATQAEAIKYAERMDRARLMYKNGEAGLEDYLARNLPYSVDDFKKMFNKGHLDLDTPIVHARSGTSTFDTVTGLKPEYREMVDATKSEYNLAGSIDSSFTADRNLVLDTVQEKNGFMAIAAGRQLDPYDALNSGLGQAVRNLWMNDYKIQAVQQWIEEFGDVMKPRFKELSNNPMFFLYNPQWNEAVVDKARLAAAKASQRAIVNFVGARSEVGSQITFLQNKLMDSVYGKLGQGTTQFAGDHLLPAIKDPASYVRAVAFHSKLGMFNPIQLFVQAQSLSNVMAVAGPKRGLEGATAAFLMRRMAHTSEPAVINKFADMAGNLGWNRDQFLEMYDAFRKTGLYEVAGEAALRDDVFDPKLFRSTFGAWLDKGTFFFNEGERIVRLSAFAAAYRDFKAANPAIRLGNREIGEIMSRADTLSASMTRASAASWQNGILSIPTQFMAFNARIMEQFFSKRLTAVEKARMAATYASLYGVPATIGAAAGVWPFYDDIKEAAIKRGIDLSPVYMKGLMEGIPSTAFSVITGKDYNFSQRYSPGGNTMFRDLVRGDKSFIETMGGPSASIIGDIWGATQPAAKSLYYLTKGSSEDFPTRKEDWLAIINNSSTASLITRIYTAVAYGKYISKNNVQVGDMDNMDAVMSILGVTPRHITDTYLISKAGKEDAAVKKSWEDAAVKEFTQGLQALDRGDSKAYSDYMSRFNTYMNSGDFTIEDQNRIYDKISKYQFDLEEKVREEFYRRAPQSQQQKRFDSLQSFFENRK